MEGNSRRLTRSRDNRVIAGVCGGIGNYFNIDPVIVRILWLLAFFGAGAGLLAYIIAWLVIPEDE
ncbi:PspC domain-containing protein [bacterium]|nr:PspC domain-containing protein [bacterium]